jgi:hypothetical protein
MSKSILEEAMDDAKLLKETAIENAKSVLIEAISPKIKEFVESQIGEAEGTDVPASEETPDLEIPEEGTMEGMGMYEAEEEEKDELEEGAEEDKEEEKVEEVVEITNEDLKKAFSEILKRDITEATVTKSFGDVQDPTPKTAGGKGETGIADEKSGEHQWAEEEAPNAQDWSVKEAFYKKQIKTLSGHIARLQKEGSEYKNAFVQLKRNLQEVNLFNSKLLYTNKLLQNTELSNKQRIGVIEAFDRAQSLREVQLVYKSLSESLKIAGALSESKKTLKGPKASRPVSSSGTSSTLNEGATREAGEETFQQRMARLAGLVE